MNIEEYLEIKLKLNISYFGKKSLLIFSLTFVLIQPISPSMIIVRNLVKKKLSLMKKQYREYYNLGVLQFVHAHVLLIRAILLVRDVEGV